MGALLQQFAASGVRFELSDDGRLDAIGPLTDVLRADIRAHKATIVAELTAANQTEEFDAIDDRRRCGQCRNLNDRGQCLAAFRGQPLGFSVPRVYHPIATLPQHCAGYAPFPDDPDQRSGYERWPRMRTARP
jgi:hypothetical protein